MNLNIPDSFGEWSNTSIQGYQWQPFYQNPTSVFHKQHQIDAKKAGVYLVYYKSQSQDAELVNAENKMARTKDPVWHVNYQHTVKVDSANYEAEIREWRLKSRSKKILVWRAYFIGNSIVFNRYSAKLAESMNILFNSKHSGAAILVYTEIEDENETSARQVLGQYMKALLPVLQQAYIQGEK